MSVRSILEGDEGPLVERKILIFRRLEPGDVRAPGARPMPESPYVEAKVVTLAIGKSTHDDMVRLAKRRAEVLDAGSSLLHRYDVPGMIIATGAAGFLGSYFDYVPERFRTGLAVTFVLGVVLAFVTRSLRRSAEEAALARWAALPESKEHDRLARELSEAWERFAASLKRQHEGFHTELRVAEGSSVPERLCAIDPRPFADRPPRFDPEDWLPTEGGGIRYEVVDGMGEIVTRALEGVDDVPEAAGEGAAASGGAGGEAEEGAATGKGDAADAAAKADAADAAAKADAAAAPVKADAAAAPAKADAAAPAKPDAAAAPAKTDAADAATEGADPAPVGEEPRDPP